ncbi:MAG: branched-chain amino acid ABC transporter permease [Deltaproteobacteria bacterium]|nr:MAG: branched-chain amino acid ABC transporter permease [Deltaproteobacteria bacterium]RUA00538.1 MAG: branched-chain amino acid ABC transporter permease [Deltaproteobacteria bacterium]
MESFIINLLNGLSWGMLLFLISVGLTTVFGVLGVLNFAHGSFFMLGAYLCMQVMHIVPSFWVGLLVGPLVVALLAALVEKQLLRRVYGRDIAFQLLLTFAILLVLDDGVRIIWGPGYHVVEPPAVLAGVFSLFDNTYPIYRLFLVFAGPVIGLMLWAFFRFSRWGKRIRAAAMDPEMAEGIGIRVPLLFTAVFALGCWLAGMGGALAAPHQSLAPAMGERIIIESFIVVVAGGMGSFPGAFIGALALGLFESFGTVFLGRVQMAIPYIVLAAVLLIRPRGLFGQED